MGKYFERVDWLASILLLLLASVGLFVLLTISPSLFWQQLLYVIVSLFLMLFVSRLDPAILWWFAPLGYIGSLLFLASTFLGPSIRGAQRWIFLGGIQLQPSELVKPFLLLFFAQLLSLYPPKSGRNVFLHLVIFFLPFVLVFRQPDMGTSIVYASLWVSMLVAAGLPLAALASGVASGILGIPFVWRLMADYQRARIITFLNPGFDPQGAGYNALQSMIAVGSGMMFGRGLGRGTQSHLRFLPEHHTDFIFATLVEELGFFGGLVLLVAYGALLWRILQPLMFARITERFPFTFATGLFAMVLSQIFINTGMNMGIVPITGITLPFVSFGGSSILSLAISFGMLWSFGNFKGVAMGSQD